MARAINLAEGFEHVRELTRGSENAGAQNAGVHIVRRIGDGILCIKKTLWYKELEESPELWASIIQQEVDVIQTLKKSKIPHINRYVRHENIGGNGAIDLYTKFCDLGPLDSLMERYNGRGLNIPEEFVWHIFDSMSRALAYLHFGCNSMTGQEAQPDWDYVVHGDLKPGNIFLQSHPGHKYPTAVLGDFGCSTSRDQFRHMQRHNNIGLLSTGGTRAFFPPERPFDQPQVRKGDTVTMRGLGTHADIWALGVTLMLMMNSWDHRRNQQGFGAVRNEAHINLIDSAPYTPQLRRTVKSTLRMEPREREQSKTLVRLIKAEFRSAVHEHGLRNLRNVSELPSWALPIPQEALSARNTATPAPGNSGSAGINQSPSNHVSRPSPGRPGNQDGPNSLRRQAAEAAGQRAQQERERQQTNVTAGSRIQRHESERLGRSTPPRNVPNSGPPSAFPSSAAGGRRPLQQAPAPTPASNRSRSAIASVSVSDRSGRRWPQPRADAIVLPRAFVQ